MKKHLFFLLVFITLSTNKLLAQTASATITYTGFQACGGCTVCGADYWCFNTASSYCGNTVPCRTVSFTDPCPPGNIVTSVTVNYFSADCAGGAMTASINGQATPTVNEGNTGCLCSNSPCAQSATSSATYPCGLPGYVNGGVNNLQMCTGASVCINRVVLVFSYAPANQATPATQPPAPTGPTSVCAGTTYTYSVSAVNASTYTWSVPPGWTINSGQGTTTITATPGGAGNICVVASNLCGSSASSCLAVNISTPSTAPASASASPNPICPSTPTTLSVSGGSLGVGANWNWYAGGCGGAVVGTGSSIVVSPASNTTYFVNAVGTCNTTACASVAVNVGATTPPPGAPTGSTSVCYGDTQPYSTSGSAGATSYTWTVPGGAVINSGQGTSSISVTFGSGSGNVCVTASGPCGTSSASCTPVTLTAPAVATFSYPGSPYCQNAANPFPTFSGGGTAGTFTASPGGLSINSANGQVNLGASSPGTYTVTNTIAATGGCPAVTATSNITVTPLPVATFSYAGSPYCQNAANPSPTYSGGGVAGNFTSSPAGLSINAGSGLIDLLSSTPGTYTVTNSVGASGGCPGTSASSTVTINPVDNASFTYPASTFCQSGTDPIASITGTGGGTFSASPGGLVFINTSTGEIDLSASALNTYTITYSTPGACPASSTVSLTITNAPSASFSYASGSYCQNAANPSPVFGAGASGGTFTFSPAGLSIDPATGIVDLAGSTPGTYTITNTIAAASGCASSTATASITIDPNQSAAFSYSTSTFCQSGTDPVPVITGAAGGTFSSSPAGLTFVNASTGEIDLSASALNTYTITYTSPGPCASTATVSITIANAPSATFSYSGGATTFCQSDPNPTPTGNLGTFSSSSSGLVFVSTTTGEISLAGSTAGTYTVYNTISGGGCATSIDSLVITINASPVITNASGLQLICTGNSCSFVPTSSIAGSTYTWTASGSSGAVSGYSGSGTGNIAELLSNSGTTSETVTYVLTCTNGSCSSTTPFNFVVTVDPVPTITNPPGTQTICSGNAASFVPTSGVTDATFNWSASSTTITGFTASGTGNIADILTNPGTTMDSVIYSITASGPAPSSCAGTTPYNFVVYVNPVPIITNPSGTQTICSSGLASFTPTSSIPGASYTWTTSASSPSVTGFSATGSGNISETLVNSGTTSESVTYAITAISPAPDSCSSSAPFNFVVTVDPIPTISNVSNSQSICSGATASFTPTSAVAGSSYSWTSSVTSGAVSGSAGAGSGNISEVLTNTSATSGTVTYAITPVGPAPSSCTSASPFNLTVTVNPLPAADSSSMVVTNANCGLSTGSVTGVAVVSGTSPITYSWQDSSGNVVGTNLDLTNVAPGNYILTITDSNSCSVQIGGANGISIVPTAGVTAAFTATPTTGETPLTVNFANQSVGGVNYVWQFGTGDSSTVVNPVYIYTPLGSFTACLIADNGAGCSDTACSVIDVFINSVFVIPNVFTPNGDNINDVFAVQGKGLKTMDANIFNRWGEKEYEWHTTNGGWDGRTSSGVPAPDGTYFFMIKATGIDGKEYEEKGSFTLIR